MSSVVDVTVRRHDDVDLERDRTLVERCQAGDQRAFEDLYLRYRERLYRFCQRRLNDSSDAEDAVQEAFARAWKAMPNFSGEKRFYPWLSVIAANLCTDISKRGCKCTPVEEHTLDLLVPAVDGGQDRFADGDGDRDILFRALGQLSDRHREVLELRESRNWSYQQIAAHAGVEVSTIETLLFRARRSLKREFMQLARSEGALGVLAIPLFAFRRAFRRSWSAARSLRLVRTAGTGAKAAGIGGTAVTPALGGVVVAVVAAAAIAGGSVMALNHSTVASARRPVATRTTSARLSGSHGAAGHARTPRGSGRPGATVGAHPASKSRTHVRHAALQGSGARLATAPSGLPGVSPASTPVSGLAATGTGGLVGAGARTLHTVGGGATSTAKKLVHKVHNIVKKVTPSGLGGVVPPGVSGVSGLTGGVSGLSGGVSGLGGSVP